MRVFLFLAAVLADEGAVLIELSVPALPVVHQAVVTFVAPHRAVGRCPAAFQWLVVFCVTIKKDRKGLELEGRLRKQFRLLQSAVVRNPGATQRTGYYSSISILHEKSGFSTAQMPQIIYTYSLVWALMLQVSW